MEFPRNPIQFLDNLIDRHKDWLRERNVASETLVYMGENVDQAGRGLDFIRHYVFNDQAQQSDPLAADTDLAMLQLYEYWRERNNMRPIEAWDGTKLRPWLPPQANPKIPALLDGSLSDIHLASYRGESWQSHVDRSHTRGPAAIDVLGNAAESYFEEIRRFDVWSTPNHWNPAAGGGHHGGHHAGHGSDVGPMRLYRHNDFNNIEVAPYSIRFWGFLKWIDRLRRRLLKEPDPAFIHDAESDISFMDRFNLDHFPWHDDVFKNGMCPEWNNQFGLRKHHKYKREQQGFCLEFLEFHSDLMAEYNKWLDRMGYLPTSEWRQGVQPFVPGVHDSGYMLRSAWPASPWGRGHSNGKGLKYYIWGKDLFDPDLVKFETVAELGYFFEEFRSIHGFGHVEHCDFRDQYLNNYSLRFFHWHQWIDDLYTRIKQLGHPQIKPDTDLDAVMKDIVDHSKFTPSPEPEYPLTGRWRYRSYHNEHQEDDSAALWFAADLTLTENPDGSLEGLLDSGHPDYQYDVVGKIDSRNVRYQTEPDWFDDRTIIVLKATGATDATKDHVYEYRGYLSPSWPDGRGQISSFTGSMSRTTRPDDPTKEGKIGSFVATRIADTDSLS